MTLNEIENSTKEVLTCQDVAEVLKCNPATLHMQAMEQPRRLGFPVIVMGTRVKIPRKPFLDYMNGGKGPDKGSCIERSENGYTVWYDGKQVAEVKSLGAAGRLLDELCYRNHEEDSL